MLERSKYLPKSRIKPVSWERYKYKKIERAAKKKKKETKICVLPTESHLLKNMLSVCVPTVQWICIHWWVYWKSCNSIKRQEAIIFFCVTKKNGKNDEKKKKNILYSALLTGTIFNVRKRGYNYARLETGQTHSFTDSHSFNWISIMRCAYDVRRTCSIFTFLFVRLFVCSFRLLYVWFMQPHKHVDLWRNECMLNVPNAMRSTNCYVQVQTHETTNHLRFFFFAVIACENLCHRSPSPIQNSCFFFQRKKWMENVKRKLNVTLCVIFWPKKKKKIRFMTSCITAILASDSLNLFIWIARRMAWPSIPGHSPI